MQGHSYLVKTVLELYNVGDKMSLAFKDSPGNPFSQSLSLLYLAALIV